MNSEKWRLDPHADIYIRVTAIPPTPKPWWKRALRWITRRGAK